MSIFWKGFAIFWIIFLVWYLTGGPQRGAKSPVMTNEIGTMTSSTQKNSEENYSFGSSGQIESSSDKSFSPQLKTNTINLNN